MMKKLLLYLLMILTVNLHGVACDVKGNYVIIHGSTFTLELYDQNDYLIKSYHVGLGKNGLGKTKFGDKKTPLGKYQIMWKASRFSETDGGYRIAENQAFCGPHSIFTIDPHIGFDDEQLWTDGYGGDVAVVMGLNYPNAMDLEKGYTGECIEIHASLLGGIGHYVSAGCVRMNPSDARDLYQHVDIGTTVIIQED